MQGHPSSSSSMPANQPVGFNWNPGSFLKLKRIVFKPEEDQPRCTSISNIIAVFENPLHFVTCFQSLLPSAPFIKFIQLPCYPAVYDITYHTYHGLTLFRAFLKSVIFCHLCIEYLPNINSFGWQCPMALPVCERKICHSIMIIKYFKSLHFLVFSPSCCQAGPEFLGTLLRH